MFWCTLLRWGLRFSNLLLFCTYSFHSSVMSFFYSNSFCLFPCVEMFDTFNSIISVFVLRLPSICWYHPFPLPSKSIHLLSCMISWAFCTHLGLSLFHIYFSTLILNSCLIQCFWTYSLYVLFLCFQEGPISNEMGLIWKNQEGPT